MSATFPPVLFLKARGQQADCAGAYAIVKGKYVNGMPVWRRRGGGKQRWLGSTNETRHGKSGRWMVTNEDTESARGWYIMSAGCHLGWAPHVPARWTMVEDGDARDTQHVNFCEGEPEYPQMLFVKVTEKLDTQTGPKRRKVPSTTFVQLSRSSSSLAGSAEVAGTLADYTGVYMLVADARAGGMPLWKCIGDGSERWLYSATSGKWMFAKPDKNIGDGKEFYTDVGRICSAEPHGGHAPHALQKWEAPSATGAWSIHVSADALRHLFDDDRIGGVLDLERAIQSQPSGCIMTPILSDNETFTKLQTLLTVEWARELGKGKDVRDGRRKGYTELHLVHAWEISSAARTEAYETQKHRIRTEILKSGLHMRNNKMMYQGGSRLDSLEPGLRDLDRGVKESWLLHGTKYETLYPILRNGLSEKFSGGMLGNAVYLAEDPEKMDQYTTTSPPPTEEMHALLEMLYRTERTEVTPVVDACYAFVCRAALGVTLVVEKVSDEKHWASPDKRELKFIPGSVPPVPYHSLLAKAGHNCSLKRFREFAVHHRDAVLPQYLLSYTRFYPGDAQRHSAQFTSSMLASFEEHGVPQPLRLPAETRHRLRRMLLAAEQERIRKFEKFLLPAQDPKVSRIFDVRRLGDNDRVHEILASRFKKEINASKVMVWEISSNSLARHYYVHREKVRSEMLSDEAKFRRQELTKDNSSPRVHVQSIGGMEDLLHSPLDPDVNEALLFHGSKKYAVSKILHSGLNERFSDGLYGKGTYLAEKAEKSNWYTDMDAEPDDSFLHHLLFPKAEGALHPGSPGHGYMFVCRVALGFPYHVASPEDARESAFATDDQSELIAMGGTKGTIPYHSLVAAAGGSQHREFIIFRSQCVQPLYLVAYQAPPAAAYSSPSTATGLPTVVSQARGVRAAGVGHTDWLLDPRLDAARVGIEQVVHKLKQCEEWTIEAERWWESLQQLESAKPAMATQLFQGARREAAASVNALSDTWVRLSNELQVRLDNLQKVGGTVIGERMRQAEKETRQASRGHCPRCNLVFGEYSAHQLQGVCSECGRALDVMEAV